MSEALNVLGMQDKVWDIQYYFIGPMAAGRKTKSIKFAVSIGTRDTHTFWIAYLSNTNIINYCSKTNFVFSLSCRGKIMEKSGNIKTFTHIYPKQ